MRAYVYTAIFIFFNIYLVYGNVYIKKQKKKNNLCIRRFNNFYN